MKLIGSIAVLGAILMAVTTTVVPQELGLDDSEVITVYLVAIVVALAGLWLLLRKANR